MTDDIVISVNRRCPMNKEKKQKAAVVTSHILNIFLNNAENLMKIFFRISATIDCWYC